MRRSYTSAIEAGLAKHYRTLEQEIMSDIVRRIKKAGKITSSADWQLNRLIFLGKSSEDLKKLVASAVQFDDAEVEKLYQAVIEEEYTVYRKQYEEITKEFIPYSENLWLQQIAEAMIRQTKGDLINITRSMGFMLKQGAYTPLSAIYDDYLDQAIVDITSGALDYNTVIRRVVGEMTRSGLRTDHAFSTNPTDYTGIDYPSGWHNRIDVAARRAILTGVSQLTDQITRKNAEILGVDRFEVSWHVGARPEHAEWQGKVYTMEQLEDICGLGTGAGLLGWNCRHSYYLFFPGSERQYTDEWLEEQREAEAVKQSFRGREYNTYEATQKQRRMETNMRAQRSKVRLLEEGEADPDDIVIAKCKYQAQLDEYREFSRKFRLPEQKERIYADLKGRVAPSKKQYAIYTQALEKTAFNGLQQSDLGKFKKHIALDERVGKEYYECLKTRFSHGTDIGKALFNKFVEQGVIADSAYLDVPCYNPRTQKIYMNYTVDQNNPRGSGVTYFHEHGHYIDDKAGGISKNIDIAKLLDDDIMCYKKKLLKEGKRNINATIETIIGKSLTDMRMHSAVSDLMDGATQGKIRGVSSHPKGYYSKHPENLGKEAFAHIYEAQFDRDRRKQLIKYFPQTVEQIEGLMRKALI